jgi:UDP-glucose 4-epimerase
MINRLTGNKAGIDFAPRRKWDNKSRILASVEKANKLIGYAPSTTFEQGLPQAIEWFKANWANIQKAASFAPGASSAVRQIVSK